MLDLQILIFNLFNLQSTTFSIYHPCLKQWTGLDIETIGVSIKDVQRNPPKSNLEKTRQSQRNRSCAKGCV